MNIYTASKFENHEVVRTFNAALRAQGHNVTWDWTITEEFDTDGSVVPGSLTESNRRIYGYLDYAGVMAAELLIVIDGDWCLNGARWEAGMAIGKGAKVWIVNYTNKVIFDVLPQVQIIKSTSHALRLLEPAVAVA